MSSGNLYPPQAFTREMLSQAFVWLQAQPDSIRELAKNPEALIALYLKTQRSQLHNQKKMESQNSNPYADAPVSAQNFMTDLKSLAEGLKQFEDPTPPNLPPVPVQAAQNFSAQLRSEIPLPRPAVNLTSNLTSHSTSNPNSNSNSNPTSNPTSGLNSNSQCMIREVKEKFNLSTDTEALNMLVAIAYKNLKSLID